MERKRKLTHQPPLQRSKRQRVALDIEFLGKKYCPECCIRFPSVTTFQNHIVMLHQHWYHADEIPIQEGGALMDLKLKASAFQGVFRDYSCNLNEVIAKDVSGVINSLKSQIENVCEPMFTKFQPFKIQFIIKCLFSKEEDGKTIFDTRDFPSFLFPCHSNNSLNTLMVLATAQLQARIEEYTNGNSGWVFERILEFKLQILEYSPFSGGNGKVCLQEILEYKKYSLINVPADDNLCFKRSVEAYFIESEIPQKHKKRTLERKDIYEKKTVPVDWSDIKFPFTLNQIPKFEKNNPNIALTIIVYSDEINKLGEDVIEPLIKKEKLISNDIVEY